MDPLWFSSSLFSLNLPAAWHVSLFNMQSLQKPVYVWAFLKDPWWNDSHWSLFPWGIIPRVWERNKSKELVNQDLVTSDIRGDQITRWSKTHCYSVLCTPYPFIHPSIHAWNKEDRPQQPWKYPNMWYKSSSNFSFKACSLLRNRI